MLDDDRRDQPADEPHPPRADGRLQQLPQPGAAGEDHLDGRRHLRRAPRLGHRRRLVRERVPRLRLRVPEAEGPHRDAARDGRDREEHVDRAGDDVQGRRTTSCRGRNCDPKPLQDPHPPVWIGGGGEQLTLRVVARHADCSNFGGNPEQWAHKREVLRGHCADVGRDPDDDPHDVVAGGVHPRAPRPRSRPPGTRSLWGEPVESWRAGNLVGTPEQVAEKIQTYVDLGCRGFIPWCADYPDTETLELLRHRGRPQLPLAPSESCMQVLGVTTRTSNSDGTTRTGGRGPRRRRTAWRRPRPRR